MANLAPASGPASLSGLDHADELLATLGEAAQTVLGYSGVRCDDVNANSCAIFVGWNKH